MIQRAGDGDGHSSGDGASETGVGDGMVISVEMGQLVMAYLKKGLDGEFDGLVTIHVVFILLLEEFTNSFGVTARGISLRRWRWCPTTTHMMVMAQMSRLPSMMHRLQMDQSGREEECHQD